MPVYTHAYIFMCVSGIEMIYMYILHIYIYIYMYIFIFIYIMDASTPAARRW